MKGESVRIKIYRFYRDGFQEMTWGKTLWLIILIKLFILFVILRIFFFPTHLGQFDSQAAKEDYVSGELINRAITP
ncbi:DUF4492 domain-containing protein [Parabacteroides sp. 52]|uniref:DUF4492 domain-containing protein n=1 Tax=unclassified Parabacteroides TaxID=2649774 RepID=UPI0013D75016|nr:MULTISPECIES: DUF4492 domain-containing protein [unclassified Parabacteroides]MDH6535743.1 nitrogen fixation-related uncharacterized protein [Parabacteroides sp. PM5-20]NDV56360.1 DUF4492 domain-containing protein [Parabacteroides sp. 52]